MSPFNGFLWTCSDDELIDQNFDENDFDVQFYSIDGDCVLTFGAKGILPQFPNWFQSYLSTPYNRKFRKLAKFLHISKNKRGNGQDIQHHQGLLWLAVDLDMMPVKSQAFVCNKLKHLIPRFPKNGLDLGDRHGKVWKHWIKPCKKHGERVFTRMAKAIANVMLNDIVAPIDSHVNINKTISNRHYAWYKILTQ